MLNQPTTLHSLEILGIHKKANINLFNNTGGITYVGGGTSLMQ